MRIALSSEAQCPKRFSAFRVHARAMAPWQQSIGPKKHTTGVSDMGLSERIEAMTEPSTVASAVRPNQPARQVIATFDRYADAEAAVDALADRDFPVHRVAIVGRDLELVEQVLGRMNYGKAALRGALAGGITGILIGLIFGLFDVIRPLYTGLVLAGYGLILGAAVGAALAAISYGMQRGRRDFDAVSALQPKHFDIVADCAVADDAVRLLAGANRTE
jgi:hypothetical protein